MAGRGSHRSQERRRHAHRRRDPVGEIHKGLPDGLPAWNSPLPFSYESTGIETRFTNGLDPEPRSRRCSVFINPKPWPDGWISGLNCRPPTCHRLREANRDLPLPHPADAAADRRPLAAQAAGDQEPRTIVAREPAPRSRADGDRMRQDAPAIIFIYRLIKFAGAKRVLFLVDRGIWGADPEGISAVRLALQQLQIQRRVHRPAPDLQYARHHGPGLHQHDPAPLLHAQRRGSGRRRRGGIRRRSG